MLSFMKESGPEGPLSGNGQNPQSKEDDFIQVSAQDSNVKKTTYLLFGLFVIGLVGLVFMIKKSTPQSASAATVTNEETQIEIAISKITGLRKEMFSRMDQIVNKFYEFSNVEQVEVDDLSKNPFEQKLFLNSLNIDKEKFKANEPSNTFKDLKLFTVMKDGNRNCCMINDTILYEGDAIKECKVLQISEGSVELESNGFNFILKLGE